jgi:low temperature requirement protein LtrA
MMFLSWFLGFVALFIPVWWSWIGVTFYNSRFETGHRLLTLLQMAAAAFMAVNVPHSRIHDRLGMSSKNGIDN